MCFVVGANFAGRKKLLLRAQNLDCESEEQLIVDQMDLKKEFPELNKNLYPSIEPYSTGFLKVSDLHTIYWEQSGHPNGHVSFFPYFSLSDFWVCWHWSRINSCFLNKSN